MMRQEVRFVSVYTLMALKTNNMCLLVSLRLKRTPNIINAWDEYALKDWCTFHF